MRLQAARDLEEERHSLYGPVACVRPAGHAQTVGLEPFASIKLYRSLDAEIRSSWRELAENAIQTPYQDLQWYEAWLATVGKAGLEEPFIVAVFDSVGKPAAIVPLVLVHRRSVTVVRFPGGKHANYNFPLVRRGVDITPRRLRFLSNSLADVSSGVDLYWFDALPPQWAGTPNPLLIGPRRRHAAVSSVIDLRTAQTNSLSLSFRHRSSYRKLQKLGATIERSRNASDVRTVLETFLSQKAAWFRARYLPDSFRQPGIADFFVRLFSETGPGELYSLRLDGDTLAVAGVVASAERASLMFISYDLQHPLVKLGLGTHLVRSLIERMGQRDIPQFDFGLGDAEYKRLLGARTEAAFISAKPITSKGLAAACVLILIQIMKRYMKSSSRLVAAVQRFRRSLQ